VYVYETTEEGLSGQELNEIIEAFGNVLTEHFRDEISSLLSLHYLDSKALMKVWDKAHHAATRDADPYRYVM
jgi:hypothetical protein